MKAPMKDKDFLHWVACRMVKHYGEHPYTDFIHKLLAVAETIDRDQCTPWLDTARDDEVRKSLDLERR